MELAQAIILTNALGGFSSLGLSTGVRTSGRRELFTQLGDLALQILWEKKSFSVYLRPHCGTEIPSDSPEDGLDLFSVLSALVLPGRLLVQSPQGVVTAPLVPSGDHLTAQIDVPNGRFLLAVELSHGGKKVRTRFHVAEGEGSVEGS